jgi:hypothetical protein
MALCDPVAVYHAANNVEVHLVRNALEASGVEAHVIEDVSQAGTWVGGQISGIHRPEVWVNRSDVERAMQIVEAYEHRAAELRDKTTEDDTAGGAIEVTCEECGESSTFPASQRGSVQECPHCDAYLDVVDEELSD